MMGEYAEYALAGAMRRGTRVVTQLPPRSEPKACPLCAKGIRGGYDGMVAHTKSKHGMKDAAARTYVLEQGAFR